ncbi:hypothetical protein [Longimicrobium sp.]|uniref:hypothetical protein n=1 Tax=Longimicrobium sp. TaxID=2029185 RepID=UPI002B965C69|nr:hypothetical protein [Longimicrobium sp.]HSU16190.1 hypothetical protein [Longimicrobium sp.]
MLESTVGEALVPWESFYVITGAAASALTGLQFVVVTLISDGNPRTAEDGPNVTSDSITAFGTPTVVHFAAALLFSALIAAPWRSLGPLRTTLLLAGGGGFVYAAITLLRARRQAAYRPVLEDWIWHVVLPLVAYGGAIACAALLERDIGDALFIVGGVTLLLLFIGIHNAWDTVAYLAAQRVERHRGAQPADVRPTPAAVNKSRRRRR